jgi:putative FmdB family regulatory protein
MPLYDYKCSQHGMFYELSTTDESAQPRACPNCGELSARVIMIAPDLLAMKKENRAAHTRNEKSAHEPVFSTVEYRQEQKARREHKHGKGCGCGDKPIRKSALMYTADGNKMFPSARPWMISH